MLSITTSIQETEQLGIELSKELHGGDIVLLSGNLGAGKTALVKGIAKGFGIMNTITSPTFTLMNIYPIHQKESGITQLVHIDTYRLKEEEELIGIGAQDYLGKSNTVCLIEWPEKIEGILKNLHQKSFINIEIKQRQNANEREIIVNWPN